ncbi:hypothetical protein FACHB389_17990 [Nostoc calcicola FACHB-389]|nr:hypothetical protein FACHB389_17990 [Nostoc calcicola FACHB-389]
MRIAYGIDFLLGKNKLQTYDESPKFSGKLKIVLTINAISENQANRYMLQEKVWVLGTRTPAQGGNVRPKKLRSF